MHLFIYARPELVQRITPLDKPSLLLEGTWDADCKKSLQEVAPGVFAPRVRWSLDRAIDHRFTRIDRQAAAWAEQVSGQCDTPANRPHDVALDGTRPTDGMSAAYLNAPSLRCQLVKLMRLIAYFTELRPLEPGDSVELIVAADGDDDYIATLEQLCVAGRATLYVHRVRPERASAVRWPRNALWRRMAGRCAKAAERATDDGDTSRRVVLCGSPQVLTPVCRELLQRRTRIWWLHDRFDILSWCQWQATDVRQLVCNTSLGRHNELSATQAPEPQAIMSDHMSYGGIDLAALVNAWLHDRIDSDGKRQTRLITQLDAHFRDVRPDVLILDEDTSPMARAAIAIGRRHGARSVVVQKTMPTSEFGFHRLAADQVFVWGQTSAEQLAAWGVPRQRIHIAGAPSHRLPQCENRPGPSRTVEALRTTAPRLLLLAAVPPRSDQPSSVASQWMPHTYAEMLRTAFATIAAIDDAELIIQLPPLANGDPTIRALQREFRSLTCRTVRHGSVAGCLDGIDCVLNCDANVRAETAVAGVPVIQLVPSNATDLIAVEDWGMVATARSAAELERLLAKILVSDSPGAWCRPTETDTSIFAASGEAAATAIVDALFAERNAHEDGVTEQPADDVLWAA